MTRSIRRLLVVVGELTAADVAAVTAVATADVATVGTGARTTGLETTDVTGLAGISCGSVVVVARDCDDVVTVSGAGPTAVWLTGASLWICCTAGSV